MTQFQSYFTLGYQHILDWQGYDHMIFLLALLAPINIQNWKKLLLLVSAFTIGHSISLALSTLNVVAANSDLIELLIPITILISVLLNFTIEKRLGLISFVITIVFGLVHGMGFSGYLKSLLGLEEKVFAPLLSFNLGLEFGQILFSLLIVLIVSISIKYLSVKQRTINLLLSGIAGAVSIFLILERI